jgi:sugar/nucleoside kinase (ribokinase family)
MSILALGTVAFDSLKTPFGERARILGGSATHFSVSASYFTDVRLMAVVGDDFDAEAESVFHERGIDLTDLQRVPGGKTFAWKGEYGFDMNTAHTLETHLNVLTEFEADLSENARRAPVLFLGNIDPRLQRSARQQSDAKLVALDTMNFWIEGSRESLVEALGDVDLLVINDAEARELAGEPNVIRAARAIRAMGPRIVVVKRGEFGAALFSEHGYFATPAYPVEEVVDPTGAGDSFAGGMMGYLAQQDNFEPHTLKTAMAYGILVASFNVEGFGLERMQQVSREDIAERMTAYKKMLSF